MFWAKYGEQTAFRFPLIKRAVVDLAATADFTPATGDTKIGKDGGNVANTTNNPAAVGGTGSVEWTLTLTGLELQAAEVKVQIVDSATKTVEDQDVLIYTYGHPSAKDPNDWAREVSPYPAEIVATAFGSDTTAHAVAMPAVVEAGDLLIVLLANDGDATVATPAGWTQLSTTASGTAARLSCYAKKATGAEGGTTVDFVTSATEQAAAQVYRIQKGYWYGDITKGVTIGTAATGTSAAPDPPSVSPSWKRLNSLYIAVEGHDDGTSTTTLYPADYVDHQTTASAASATGAYLSSAVRSRSVTSENPAAFTITSQEWAAQTIAIRPAQQRQRPYLGVG